MDYLKAGIHWGHVAVRAAGYGALSMAFGTFRGPNPVSHWAMQQWCTGACKGLHINLELIDGHKLPRGQVIYVANHASLLDILVVGCFLPFDFRYLAKESVFKVPFLGQHLAQQGHLRVYRGRKRHLNHTLPLRIHKVVEQGASVLFFAEGTRSTNGELFSFKMGAFDAAIREGLSIQPIGLRGTAAMMNRQAMDIVGEEARSGSVTVLEPIGLDTLVGDDTQRAEQLRDLTWTAMARELGQLGDEALRNDHTETLPLEARSR